MANPRFFILKICMPRFYHRTLRSKRARPKAGGRCARAANTRCRRRLRPLFLNRAAMQRKGAEGNGAKPACAGLDVPEGLPLPAAASRRAFSGSYFRLIVVFTPCDVVLSSNQRAVTVLVCV